MTIENYHTIRYGNKDGELKFGHIHEDDNISAFMVRSGYDARHYISMDGTGNSENGRKGGTISHGPGAFQIKYGYDIKDGNPAIYIEAVNGNIILNADNGDIQLQARNINILAKKNAGDNKNGNVNIEGNERVNITAKEVTVNGKAAARFVTSGVGEITCKTGLNISAGYTKCATNISKIKETKFGLNGGDL